MTEENKEGECRRINEESNTPPLFTMKGPRTQWWTVIRLIAPSDENRKDWSSSDAVGASCIKCKTRIHFTKGNVNNVKRHIIETHPHLDRTAKSKDSRDDKILPCPKRTKVMSIKDAFATVHRQKMQPATKADQKLGEALLVNWVGTSLRPLSDIEDEGFARYTEWLNRQRTTFKLPSRTKLKQQLMQVANLVEKKIVQEIKNNMDYFCMTTDI